MSRHAPRQHGRIESAIKLAIACGVMLLAVALAEDARVERVRTQEPRNGNVRIGVLGLFEPRELTVSAEDNNALILHSEQQTSVLERSSGVQVAEVRSIGSVLVVRVGTSTVHTSTLTITGRDGGPAGFVLSVPGKIARHYRGTLELKPVSGVVVAVVSMDLETAVASVVGAEGLAGAPIEALKAQAVAARSYLVAGKGRHSEFDFCDSTHCQFLRDPPGPGSVAEAALATRGLVLAYDSQPFAAMYTRSCRGRTRTPLELGLPSGVYPYYSVDCKYCRLHPSRWQSQISARNAATLRDSDESSRLQLNRRLGWGTAPSNTYIRRKQGEHVILEGTGQGHGIGLCQSGAIAMAKGGADFAQILSHYYPNTTIVFMRRLGANR